MGKEPDETAWTDYLKQRPELNDWYKRSSEFLLKDKGRSTNDPIELMRNYRTFCLDLLDLHDRVVGLKEPCGVFDFDDGEALAYVIGFDHPSIRELMMSSINHVSRPSTNMDEITNIYGKYSRIGGEPYFMAECLRVGNHADVEGILDAEDRAEDMFSKIDQLHGSGLTHVRWDTDEDFFRTICEYGGKANIFRSPCSNMTIDKDYLDHYLLAPKPSPNEVSEKDWHDRSVRLVEQLDKDANDVEEYSAAIPDEEDATTVRFNDFMATTLLDCFLTHNVEDLTFMDTIYGFCTGLFPDDHNWRCHTGAFKSEVFDMLRKYGPSFTGPLFENALSE